MVDLSPFTGENPFIVIKPRKVVNMKMFTVDTSNRYLLRIKKIEAIEDAGDDFTTEEELRELLGLGEHDYLSPREVQPNDALIKQEVAAWKAKIPAGSKSIVCTDIMLVETLRELATWSIPISSFVQGLRRLDNKFILADTKVRKVNKNDYARLINLMVGTINIGKKYNLEIKYYIYDRVGTLELLKKLLTWEEIAWDRFQATEEDKALMRQIWDNPAMFDAAETDK